MMNLRQPEAMNASDFFEYGHHAERLKRSVDSFAAAVGLLSENVNCFPAQCEQRDLEALLRICGYAYKRVQERCAALGITGQQEPRANAEASSHA